jgi:hypothetical protein
MASHIANLDQEPSAIFRQFACRDYAETESSDRRLQFIPDWLLLLEGHRPFGPQ